MGKDDIRLVGGAEAPALPGKPTILAAIGRQRVGKTSFENALAQVVKEKGGDVEVVNADTLNRSHSISTFHPGATTAPNVSMAEQALWMERTLTRIMGEGRDAIIDVGGGHTALHQVIEETPLAELMEDAGISLVVAYVLGPDAADIDYLDMLMNENKFHPHRSLVVLNEGLAPQGHNPITAFKTTREHPVVRQVLARGGHVVSFPALKAMGEVTKRGLPYRTLLNSFDKDRSITPFDMHRIRRWYEQDFSDFLRTIPAGWLPRLPEGAIY